MAKTSETSTPPPQGLQELLGTDVARPWWRRPVTWLAPVLLLAAGAAWLVWQDRQTQSKAPSYVTEPVRKGDITLTVSANGTLQPTRSVNIGSELSGTVKQVLVDVNDRVKKGDVMVVLDTAKLSDQVDRSTAALLWP